MLICHAATAAYASHALRHAALRFFAYGLLMILMPHATMPLLMRVAFADAMRAPPAMLPLAIISLLLLMPDYFDYATRQRAITYYYAATLAIRHCCCCYCYALFYAATFYAPPDDSHARLRRAVSRRDAISSCCHFADSYATPHTADAMPPPLISPVC